MTDLIARIGLLTFSHCTLSPDSICELLLISADAVFMLELFVTICKVGRAHTNEHLIVVKGAEREIIDLRIWRGDWRGSIG
jgi:hypothetical protein